MAGKGTPPPGAQVIWRRSTANDPARGLGRLRSRWINTTLWVQGGRLHVTARLSVPIDGVSHVAVAGIAELNEALGFSTGRYPTAIFRYASGAQETLKFPALDDHDLQTLRLAIDALFPGRLVSVAEVGRLLG